MNIQVHEDDTGFAPRDCRFNAIDADSYEGGSTIGYGATPQAAIADFLEIALDECEITEDEHRALLARYSDIA